MDAYVTKMGSLWDYIVPTQYSPTNSIEVAPRLRLSTSRSLCDQRETQPDTEYDLSKCESEKGNLKDGVVQEE